MRRIKLLLWLPLLWSLTGCAELAFQPERTKQWPELGLRIAVLVIPASSKEPTGVRQFQIRKVRSGSPAESAGVLPGDQLIAMDGKDITSVSDAILVMRNKSLQDHLLLSLRRAEEFIVLSVDLAKADLRSSF